MLINKIIGFKDGPGAENNEALQRLNGLKNKIKSDIKCQLVDTLGHKLIGHFSDGRTDQVLFCLKLAEKIMDFFSEELWKEDHSLPEESFTLVLLAMLHLLPYKEGECFCRNVLRAVPRTIQDKNIRRSLDAALELLGMFHKYERDLAPVISLPKLDNFSKALFVINNFKDNPELLFFILLKNIATIEAPNEEAPDKNATRYLTMKFISLIFFRKIHGFHREASSPLQKKMEKEWVKKFEDAYLSLEPSLEDARKIRELKLQTMRPYVIAGGGSIEVHSMYGYTQGVYYTIINRQGKDQEFSISKNKEELFEQLQTRGIPIVELNDIWQQLNGIDYLDLYDQGIEFINDRLLPSIEEQLAATGEKIGDHVLALEYRIKAPHRMTDDRDDLMGIRFVCHDRDKAYILQQVVHSLYTAIPGRDKDFFEHPRANGYSNVLHSTYQNMFKDLLNVEIQYVGGSAAHINNQYGKDTDHILVYSNKLNKDLDLNAELIYVTGSKKDLLPKDSPGFFLKLLDNTSMDIYGLLYQISRHFKNINALPQNFEVILNGHKAPLTHNLRPGDIIRLEPSNRVYPHLSTKIQEAGLKYINNDIQKHRKDLCNNSIKPAKTVQVTLNVPFLRCQQQDTEIRKELDGATLAINPDLTYFGLLVMLEIHKHLSLPKSFVLEAVHPSDLNIPIPLEKLLTRVIPDYTINISPARSRPDARAYNIDLHKFRELQDKMFADLGSTPQKSYYLEVHAPPPVQPKKK